MNKEDQSILEEIKKRVFEAEKNIQKSENRKINFEANTEALAEISLLDKDEVDLISQQVKKEFQLKKIQRKRIIKFFFGIILLSIIFSIIFIFFFKEEIIFEEFFDDNANGWSISESYIYKRNFVDEGYLFSINNKGYCYMDLIDLPENLPDNYVIILESVWYGGNYDEYGFALGIDYSNYYSFNLRGDGAASFSYRYDQEWVINEPFRSNFGNNDEQKSVNTVKIMINNKLNASYYINEKLYKKGIELAQVPLKMGIRACGSQEVLFQKLIIKELLADNAIGKTIFYENFKQNINGWSELSQINKNTEIRDGRLYFETNKEKWCYWASIDYDFPQNYRIEADLFWHQGEEANFGIMFIENNSNYMAFTSDKNGKSRYVEHKNGEFSFTGAYKNLNIEISDIIPARLSIEIKNNNFIYKINDSTVAVGKINDFNFRKIGFRSCGRQTVSFDNLKIIKI